MSKLRQHLTEFHRNHQYLPGSLEFLLQQSWASDDTLLEEATKKRNELMRCDDRTKREQAFVDNFLHLL